MPAVVLRIEGQNGRTSFRMQGVHILANVAVAAPDASIQHFYLAGARELLDDSARTGSVRLLSARHGSLLRKNKIYNFRNTIHPLIGLFIIRLFRQILNSENKQ